MIQNRVLTYWLTLVTMVLLSSCSRFQATQVPEPTITVAASRVPTVQRVSIPAPIPALTPTRASIAVASKVYQGWLQYTNAKYRFSVHYPSDWMAQEVQGSLNTMSGHAVYLGPRSTNLVRMVVGFRRPTEDVQITRTGVGAGDIVRRGSVIFLGEPVDRDVLVLNGKDLAILYQGSGEIRRDDLVFTLSLDYRGLATDKSALTPETESTADKIIGSFQVIR